MSVQDNNPLLRLVKRALGFRTGDSNCCSGAQETVAEEEKQTPERGRCCGTAPAKKDDSQGA